MKRTSRLRILVSIPLLTYQHRQAQEGVLRFFREHKASEWDLTLETDARCISPSAIHRGYDGIIAYAETERAWKRILDANLPTVLHDSFRSFEDMKLLCRSDTMLVGRDYDVDGKVAARYFMSRHFRHFAFFGSSAHPVLSDERRRQSFADELARCGRSCICCPQVPVRIRGAKGSNERNRIADWLSSLPHPVAVFCGRDSQAHDVLLAARDTGLEVPSQVAVLGFDDDESLCTSCTPTLSSISADISTLGCELARQLDALLSGGRGGILFYKPKARVVVRASTECEAVEDQFVAKALSWMRGHLRSGQSARSVAKEIGYSPRLLQKRFHDALGRSIAQEFRRMRAEEALRLIENTDLSIAEIALKCAFSNASHLCSCVRRLTGVTPIRYRRGK